MRRSVVHPANRKGSAPSRRTCTACKRGWTHEPPCRLRRALRLPSYAPNIGVTFRGSGIWGDGAALWLRVCVLAFRGVVLSRAACALDARPLRHSGLHIACGGAPMMRERVYGISYPARIAHATYRAISRCSVG